MSFLIHEYDIRFMKLAKEVSKFSDFKQTKMGAVITYKKELISVGYNSEKSNPMQEKFNHYRNFEHPENSKSKIHAEISAISKLPWYVYENDFQMKNACIYVFREHKCNHNLALSLPCPACMAAIKANHIGRIVYTIEDGIKEIKLA